MSSPEAGVQAQLLQVGEKRKREVEDVDSTDEPPKDEGNATDKSDSLVPRDYERFDEDDEDDQSEAEDVIEYLFEDTSEIPAHNESTEPLPKCAIYDGDIQRIKESTAAIPQQLKDRIEEHDCLSKGFEAHTSQAENLRILPQAPKKRIGVIGNAGTGKSGVVNAVTDEPDLAQSVSPAFRVGVSTPLTIDAVEWWRELHMCPDSVPRQFRQPKAGLCCYFALPTA